MLVFTLLLWIGCAETPEHAALKRADSLLDQGQIPAAFEVVNGYLRQHPTSTALLQMRVVLLVRADQPEVALHAAQSIPAGRAFLSGLLRHHDAVVRANAAKLIASHPVPSDFHELILAVEDPDPTVRRYSAHALGELKNPGALKPLFRLLADDNWFVRAETASALGKIGDARSVGWLIQLLPDPDGYVRYSAINALHELASASTQASLKHGLACARPEQEFGIAVALAKLQDPLALRPLTAAAHDKDADLRRQAAEALSECGQAEATNVLNVLLRDSDVNVRNEAAAGLEKLKNEDPGHSVVVNRRTVADQRHNTN